MCVIANGYQNFAEVSHDGQGHELGMFVDVARSEFVTSKRLLN